MPLCGKCGVKLPDDAGFCLKCGSPVHGGHVDLGDEITDALRTAGRELEAAFKTAGEEIEKTFRELRDEFAEPNGPYCVRCGKRNPQGARFCFSCGHEIPQAT